MSDEFIQKYILGIHNCPCCGYPTLFRRYATDTCFLCWWEDEIGAEDDPDYVLGGANSDYSLSEARMNFKNHLIMFRNLIVATLS